MYSVTTEQRQYQTYILTDHNQGAQLEVVPERGGIITRWRVNQQEILYLDAERFANSALSIRGGIPILFPICGNLPNNSYMYRGQSYTLKQHGFARDLPWTVVSQTDQDEAAITLSLSSSNATRPSYPFDFQLVFTYQLRGNTLTLRQQYINQSDSLLPFSTGLHPYFEVTNKADLQFEIPATQFQNQQTQTTHPFTGQFDFAADEIDVAFRPLSQTSARVIDPQRQLSLTLDYDSSYSTLVFWTIKGKEYYCLEPWSAPRNALNTGEHLIQLEPQSTLETVVRLTVSSL